MNDYDIRFLILELLKKEYNVDPHSFVIKDAILENSEISENELERNVVYLEEKALIDVQWFLGGGFFAKINSFGIDEFSRMKWLDHEEDIEEITSENVINTIIDETKEFVDSKLEELNQDILIKLNFIYEDLLTRNHPHNFARIAFDCREILMDFTDSIFSEDLLINNEKTPKRTQTKNKIYSTLKQIAESETDSKVVSERFEYIINYFDVFNDFVQKNSHPDGFQVSQEDAKVCVIYTYLFMRDILKLMKL